jgi:hypothetical protein
MPPKKGGPWQLEEVKLRLRAEQLARERAAGARYREIEEREARERQIIRLEEEALRQARAQGKGNTSWGECSLCILVLCCLLLSISVLILSSVALASLKK